MPLDGPALARLHGVNLTGTLFDIPPAEAAAIGPHTAMLDRAAAAHHAGDEVEARQALGAYLVLRAIDRAVALREDDGADAREGLRFQVASVVKFVGELPKVGHIEANHLMGIARALAEFDRDGERRLRINLLAYSWYLEEAGHLAEAVDVVAVSEPFYRTAGPHELTNLGMTAGRFHRTLAHWDLADRSYALGYESAEARQDRRGMLLARLGRAKVLLGRGNLPEARRQIEAIIAEAEGKDLADARAFGFQDLAAVFDKQAMPVESLKAQYRALQYFRDAHERTRLLGNIGGTLRVLGMLDTARVAFEQVLRDSSVWQLRANALIELISVHVGLGNELAFRRYWNEAESERSRMPPTTAVDFRFAVGTGLAQFGRTLMARQWLEDAQAVAQDHGLNEWYFRIEAALKQLDSPTLQVEEVVWKEAETSVSDDLAEISEGVRRHVASLA